MQDNVLPANPGEGSTRPKGRGNQMTKIQPHPLFSVWSADEVAECLGGVNAAGLYARLWELTIPRQNTPGLDYREIPDDFADRCLARSWDSLTAGEQATLNALAAADDAGLSDDEPTEAFRREVSL